MSLAWYTESLIRDDNDTRIKFISDIGDEYTYKAKGVNVDFILYLEKIDNSYRQGQFQIEKLFESEFSKIKEFAFNESSDDFTDIVSYVINTELINASRELAYQANTDVFNYCITLSDKYIPRIYINLEQRIFSLLESSNLAKEMYIHLKTTELNDGEKNEDEKKEAIDDIEKEYLRSKEALKKELCNYVVLWIHAYQFLEARKKLLNRKNVIAFSHRYQGWSKPRFEVNKELSFEYKTNFGYGNSSFFYLLLIYKGIQIFPFMDWVNYQYAQAAEMEKYSIRFHKEVRKTIIVDDKKRTIKEKEINQEYWKNAFNDLEEACNLSESNARVFIDKYVISALNELIKELEKIFEEDDSKINDKYRGFDYKFKIIDHLEGHTKEIKLMSVKGQIITGTLDFLGQVSQLSEFINTEDYIRKIESLNQRILPVLADTVPKCQELIEELEEKIKEYKLDLSDMWLNQGLKNYRNNKNEEEYTKSEKEKLEKVDKKYYGIVKKKKDAEQDLKHSRKLLKSISIYIRKIETYFDQVQ